MKKVSIIIPVYNVEKYLDKCLNSLVNQTLEDIEIIVINDGSIDNSQVIIDKYVEKYPEKLKAFKLENGGPGAARNFGLEKATGEYIGYVDSDDYVEYDMFENMYNKAKEEDLDIVLCAFSNVFLNTDKKKDVMLSFKSDNDKENALFNDICVWNKIFKREILNDIEFKNRVWYEDFAFTCKAIMKSKNIGFINKCFYNYLNRDGSIMNNNNIRRNLEILDAFDDTLNFINENAEYKKYYPLIEFLAIYNIYIAANVRIIISKNKRKDKIEIINKLNGYVEEKFPNYRSNKYLNLLDRNKSIIYNLIKLRQYWLVKLIFKIKRLSK